MKIRHKIIFLFMAITAGTLLLLSVFIYIFTSHFIDRNFYTRLKARASIAAQKHLVKDTSAINIYNEVRKKHLLRLVGEQEYILNTDPSALEVKDSSAPALPKSFYQEVMLKGYGEYKNNADMYVGLYYKNTHPENLILITANDS